MIVILTVIAAILALVINFLVFNGLVLKSKNGEKFGFPVVISSALDLIINSVIFYWLTILFLYSSYLSFRWEALALALCMTNSTVWLAFNESSKRTPVGVFIINTIVCVGILLFLRLV